MVCNASLERTGRFPCLYAAQGMLKHSCAHTQHRACLSICALTHKPSARIIANVANRVLISWPSLLGDRSTCMPQVCALQNSLCYASRHLYSIDANYTYSYKSCSKLTHQFPKKRITKLSVPAS